eukprot:3792873-Pyramimonas_sp.AAC.1
MHPGCSVSFKAAEIGYLVPFANELLSKHGGRTAYGDALIDAGLSLGTFLEEMRTHTCVVPPESMRKMLMAMWVHLKSCRLAHI